MSQLERVEEEKKAWKAKKTRASTATSSSSYVSFSPTKEEKEKILRLTESVEEMLDYLSTYTQDGFILSFKYMETQEAHVWTLRENGTDWKLNRALTAWHVDWLKSLRMLYYALNNRFHGWPDRVEGLVGIDLDW